MTQISAEFPFKSVNAIHLSPLCLLWPNIPPHPVYPCSIPHSSNLQPSAFSLSNLCVLCVLCVFSFSPHPVREAILFRQSRIKQLKGALLIFIPLPLFASFALFCGYSSEMLGDRNVPPPLLNPVHPVYPCLIPHSSSLQPF